MAAQYNAAAGQIGSDTTTEIAHLINVIITKIPLWIAAICVMFISYLVAKVARTIVENKLAERGIEEEHKELQILGGRMTYTGILTIGLTVGLKIAGIDLTSIIAAVAFGIGFALKDLIMNFLAGVMILMGGHFSIGDFISVGGTLGKIVEIQSRVTILQAIDGTKVIVPNADLFKKQVTSFTGNPFRRIEIVVGIDYRNDVENALRVCMKVLKNTKGVLAEPKPAVLVADFAESSINLKVRAWVDSKGGWLKIKSTLIASIKKEFDEYGISIPWPMRTIAYDKDNKMSEKILEEEKIEAAVVEAANEKEEKAVEANTEKSPEAAAEKTPGAVPETAAAPENIEAIKDPEVAKDVQETEAAAIAQVSPGTQGAVKPLNETV